MTEIGVIHARFQVLHLKQLELILAAKMRCKKLYIGISHPDIMNFPVSKSAVCIGTLT